MNRTNVHAALDDAEVQALADQCLKAMMELTHALTSRDFILAAIKHSEGTGSFSLDAVTEYLTLRLAGFVLSSRDVHDYNTAFSQWLATGDSELGEVRSPAVHFQ